MKSFNNSDYTSSLYFLEYTLYEYPDVPSEKVIKKRAELQQQLEDTYESLQTK